MSDIIDIVTRLSYELNGQGLDQALQAINQQAAAINKLESRLLGLKDAYKQTDNITEQQKIKQAIDQTTNAIDRSSKALKNYINQNSNFQEALNGELGLLQKLSEYISQATRERQSLTNPQEIKAYTDEIKIAQREVQNLLNFGDTKPTGLRAKLSQDLDDLRAKNSLLTNPIDIAKGNIAEKQLQTQISNLNKLGNVAKPVGGIIQQLTAQIDVLSKKKMLSATEAELPLINKEIDGLQNRLKLLNKLGVDNDTKNSGIIGSLLGFSGNGSLGKQLLQGGLIGLGIGSGFGLITRAVSALVEGLGILGNELFNTVSYQEQLQKSAEEVAGALNAEAQSLANILQVLSAVDEDRNTDAIKRELELIKAKGVISLEAYQHQKEVHDKEQELRQSELGDLKRTQKAYEDLRDITKNVLNSIDAGGLQKYAPFTASLLNKGKSNNEVIDEIFKREGAARDIPESVLNKYRLDLESKDLSGQSLKKSLSFSLDQFSLEALKNKEGQKDKSTEIDAADKEFASKRQNAIDQLNDALRIRIRDGNNKLKEEEIADIRTRYESAELIEMTNAKKRDDTINKINDEYNKERRNLALQGQKIDEQTEAKFNSLRGQAQKEYEDNTIRQVIAFHVKQIQEERKAQELILKEQISGLQEQLKEQQKTGEDTFGTRQALLQKQLQEEINETNKRYNAEVEAQKKLGNDTTELEKQRTDDLLIIENKYHGLSVDLLFAYYQDRLNIIKRFGDVETAEIKGSQSEQIIRSAQAYEDGLKSLRKYHEDVKRENYEAAQRQKEQDLKDARRRLQEAQELRENVLNNPNSSQADIDSANIGFSNAKFGYSSAVQANTNKGHYRNGFAKFVTNGDINNPALTEQQQLQLEVQKTAEAYQFLSETVDKSFNEILEAQQKSLDREIQVREQRVTLALKLAERGNTEALAIEQKRLEDAERQRALAARRQLAVNAALTLSSSIVAVAEAAAEGGVAAPATIAAVIAALAAGIAAATELSSSSSTGFAEGGYTGDGSKHEKAGIVHKGEYVMPKEIVSNPHNRAILEAMHRGEVPGFSKSLMHDVYGARAQSIDLKETNKKLDEVTEAVQQNRVTVHNKMDKHGWLSMTEQAAAQERRRWA